jgi:Protein of unknown function (DUF1580)
MDDHILLQNAGRFCNIPGRRPGKSVSLQTLWRWALQGLRGIKLRTQLVGGHRFTRPSWVLEFLERTAAGDPHAASPTGPFRATRHS